jgi:ribonuclease D
MPARRVLRDDLIIELARRGVTDTRRIGQIRGLHHSGFQRFLPEIAECVKRGQEGKPPVAPWSRNSSQGRPPPLLQQFMTAALSFLCRTNRIATTIVGTSDDVGKLLGYWMRGNKTQGDEMPLLLTGWRRELAGEPLHEIFTGQRALRVVDPDDEMPLGLCKYKDD